MASARRRQALVAIVAAATVAVLLPASDSSAPPAAPDPSCSARVDFYGRAAPVAVTTDPAPGSLQPGAALQASIDYVSFGPAAHLWGPARPGRLVQVRVDVLAAINTRDADLRWAVDGALLLGCRRHDLVPGRVAHLTALIRVPPSAAGTVIGVTAIGVTAIVRVRAGSRGDVLVFRRTYRLLVR